MAVKLNVHANVTGQQQLNKLNTGLKTLGNQALLAKAKLKNLELGAARARATFAALGTTLKVGVGVGLAAVSVGIGKFVKDTFSAGRLVESLDVRFKLLFNSATEGAKAFERMNTFAGKVPFSLEAIAAGSGNLAVISKDADELAKILEVTGNVAAATGLDFRQTAEQIQRSFAGGIAAADVFRERGVRAMLGFEAGAKVSVEETKKKFFEVFANGGQYSKATKEFEKTLEAQVSFVQDAYFRFRQAAAIPLFEGVTKQVKALVGDFKENDEQLKALAKTVGESLAKGFANLGKFIKFIITNFENLIKVIKVFIALKVIAVVGNIGKAMLLMATKVKIGAGAFTALNIAIRANPIGILITVIQAAVIAWIAFEKQIRQVGSYIANKFNSIVENSALKIRKFTQAIGLGSDENLEKIQELEANVNSIAASYTKMTKAQKAAFAGDGISEYTQQTLTPVQKDAFAGRLSDPTAVAAAEEKAKEIMAINERIMFSERLGIQIAAKEAGIAHQKRLDQVKELRAKLSLIGIDSKEIGGIIGDTWIQGIQEGNTLLETTQNAFKNVLISISNTIVKRSAELLVERIFNSLIDQRIMKQKALNAATSEQGGIMQGLISKAGSLFSAMGSGGGMGSKLGGLFSIGKSFLGFNQGGVVPGGAPYTDRVPAMLTPGEVVVPRNKANNQSGNTSITNINISGNVDQRSIDQIKSVISAASAEVGGANKAYTKNTQGVRGRNI
tara:strand:- start:14476 stop:16671 length:2196 start_codon:yes stop_codon:yes gene_type:complete